jgi:predicted nuclease with TOPRIM domain
MAETYKFQPNNPVDFLAKWLLNYNMASTAQDKTKNLHKQAEEKKTEYQNANKEVEKQKVEKEKLSSKKQESVDSFYKKFQESDDLEDHLQELCDFVSVSADSLCCRKTQRQPHAILVN